MKVVGSSWQRRGIWKEVIVAKCGSEVGGWSPRPVKTPLKGIMNNREVFLEFLSLRWAEVRSLVLGRQMDWR